MMELNPMLNRVRPLKRHEYPPREFVLENDGNYEVFYAPLSYVNTNAKLVLVGITPGPNQIEISYATAYKLLSTGQEYTHVMCEIKAAASFGGGMRARLVEVLNYLDVHSVLGLSSTAELWGQHKDLLHSTSILTAPVFKKGKPFNGSFDEIQSSSMLLRQFHSGFLTELKLLPEDSILFAVGGAPYQALKWCISESLLDPRRLIGRLPHPSGNSGSAVPYFTEKKKARDLKSNDPVRFRCADLDHDRAEVKHNLEFWVGSIRQQ